KVQINRRYPSRCGILIALRRTDSEQPPVRKLCAYRRGALLLMLPRCTPTERRSGHLTSKEKSMSNSPSKRAAPMTYTRFSLDKSTPTLWRVTFDNPPINLIDAVMMKELLNLLTEIERDKQVGVVLFDSADPDFFLAHYDIAGDPGELEGVETTAGRHPFTELHIRLSK